MAPSVNAQFSNCSNMDFEEGDLSGWDAKGDVQLVELSQNDPYGGFPLALSGNFGVQLGNKFAPVTAFPYHSSISRTITITEENKFFLYGFSIVLLGYPHLEEHASYVKLTVRDSLGNGIPCADYIVFAESSSGNGFYQSPLPAEANLGGQCCYDIFYKPWEIIALDLTPLIGQTLTFEMISDWCEFEVDWGYGYVDVYCSSSLMQAYNNCQDGLSYISSIPGFSSYTWTGPGIVSGQGTYQIQVNLPGAYILDIPSPNGGCPPLTVEQEVDIEGLVSNLAANFDSESSVCIGDTVSFENTSSFDGYISDLAWSFGDGDSSTNFSMEHLFQEVGTYEIELYLADEYGCVDSIVHHVSIVSPPELELGPDKWLCDGEFLHIEPALVSPGLSYAWSTGSTENSITVNSPQTLVLAVSNGCTIYDTLNIIDDPAFFGTVPNVITANYDHINDEFKINYFDIADYYLAIFNRWGERVFESTDPLNLWDGQSNHQEVLEGVYFYQLNFRLSCQETTQHRSGHLTLVR